MRLIRLAMLAVLTLLPVSAELFSLRFDRLADALRLIPDADQRAVAEVAGLIRNGNHGEALSRLNELNRSNPANSSLRIMTAYAMIQLGNYLGAYEESGHAHEAQNGNSYKCLFRAQAALLAGKTAECKRELGHVKKVGDMPQEVKAVEAQLKQRRK